MQIVKPSTWRLITEFAGRDADFSSGFRAELAAFVRCMWRLYGHRLVRQQTLVWAKERFARR